MPMPALCHLSLASCIVPSVRSLVLMAASVAITGANSQNVPRPATTIQSTCIAPVDLTTQWLYGLWDADFFDLPPSTGLLPQRSGEVRYRGSLRFERHREHANSVKGTLMLSGSAGEREAKLSSAQLSGDVEDGEMILDESDDGQRISAVWVGTATVEGCGLIIKGTRRLAGEESGHLFVMTKTPGWR